MDWTGSSHSNDGERSQPVAVGFQRENSTPKIISVEGCSKSEAFQLQSDRMYSELKVFNHIVFNHYIMVAVQSHCLAFTSISLTGLKIQAYMSSVHYLCAYFRTLNWVLPLAVMC